MSSLLTCAYCCTSSAYPVCPTCARPYPPAAPQLPVAGSFLGAADAVLGLINARPVTPTREALVAVLEANLGLPEEMVVETAPGGGFTYDDGLAGIIGAAPKQLFPGEGRRWAKEQFEITGFDAAGNLVGKRVEEDDGA